MISTLEIGWAAGLLEGEGCFRFSGRSPIIVVNMTDRDTIGRISALLGAKTYGPIERPMQRSHAPVWQAHLQGRKAAAWMMTLYPLLGHRRSNQVRGALARWRALRYVRISPAIERDILAHWDSGISSKSSLAGLCHVSTSVVYRVLRDHRCQGAFHEHRYPSIRPIEIAWLAGLVEGEGCISMNGGSLTLRIKMTDRDVVERVGTLFGARLYDERKLCRGSKKLASTAQVRSSTAAGWLMTLYGWLGKRRRKQVRDALAAWRPQHHGEIPRPVADAIAAYRAAGSSYVDIMRLLRVSKNTVYRYTRKTDRGGAGRPQERSPANVD